MRSTKQVTATMLLSSLVLTASSITSVSAASPQRPGAINQPAQNQTSQPSVAPAPSVIPVKYEGGIVGYNQKTDGTLSFDDINSRLVFRNKGGQEVFSMSYQAILSAFADTQSKRPIAATVGGTIVGAVVPFGGIPAMFIRKKYRYLTLQYSDPDTKVNGVTSFKVNSKELLSSVLVTLANKAGLEQRGTAYVRRDPNSTGTTTTTVIGQQTSP